MKVRAVFPALALSALSLTAHAQTPASAPAHRQTYQEPSRPGLSRDEKIGIGAMIFIGGIGALEMLAGMAVDVENRRRKINPQGPSLL